MIEILQAKKVSTSIVVEAIKHIEHDKFKELDFLVRICILFAYGAIKNKTHANVHEINEQYKFVKELLLGRTNQHIKMAKIITKCISECEISPRPSSNMRKIPGKCKLGSELKKAVLASIEVLLNNDTANEI